MLNETETWSRIRVIFAEKPPSRAELALFSFCLRGRLITARLKKRALIYLAGLLVGLSCTKSSGGARATRVTQSCNRALRKNIAQILRLFLSFAHRISRLFVENISVSLSQYVRLIMRE